MFSDKQAILLSDEMAIKLFGNSQNSIGKTIQWQDDQDPYIIAGVFKKPPANSTAKFDLLFNIRLRAEQNLAEWQDWSNSNPGTYIVVKKGTDMDRLNKKIYGYLQTNQNVPCLVYKPSDTATTTCIINTRTAGR
ncbi:MAG: ABC transporter permease [Bacteroidota bacterium]